MQCIFFNGSSILVKCGRGEGGELVEDKDLNGTEKRNKVEFKDTKIIDCNLSDVIELRFPYFIDEKNESIILGEKHYFR